MTVASFRATIAGDVAALNVAYSAMLTAAENIDTARVAEGLGRAHSSTPFALARMIVEPDSAATIFAARNELFANTSLRAALVNPHFEAIAQAAAAGTPLSAEAKARFIAALALDDIPEDTAMYAEVTAIPQLQPVG